MAIIIKHINPEGDHMTFVTEEVKTTEEQALDLFRKEYPSNVVKAIFVDSKEPSMSNIEKVLLEAKKKILMTFFIMRERVVQAYVNQIQLENQSEGYPTEEVERNGYIQLVRRLVHEPFADGDPNMDACIDMVHTQRDVVSIRCNGDNEDLPLNEVSNENLIGIIKQFENLINNPSQIEI